MLHPPHEREEEGEEVHFLQHPRHAQVPPKLRQRHRPQRLPLPRHRPVAPPSSTVMTRRSVPPLCPGVGPCGGVCGVRRAARSVPWGRFADTQQDA
jgi:hypothetical protein